PNDQEVSSEHLRAWRSVRGWPPRHPGRPVSTAPSEMSTGKPRAPGPPPAPAPPTKPPEQEQKPVAPGTENKDAMQKRAEERARVPGKFRDSIKHFFFTPTGMLKLLRLVSRDLINSFITSVFLILVGAVALQELNRRQLYSTGGITRDPVQDPEFSSCWLVPLGTPSCPFKHGPTVPSTDPTPPWSLQGKTICLGHQTRPFLAVKPTTSGKGRRGSSWVDAGKEVAGHSGEKVARDPPGGAQVRPLVELPNNPPFLPACGLHLTDPVSYRRIPVSHRYASGHQEFEDEIEKSPGVQSREQGNPCFRNGESTGQDSGARPRNGQGPHPRNVQGHHPRNVQGQHPGHVQDDHSGSVQDDHPSSVQGGQPRSHPRSLAGTLAGTLAGPLANHEGASRAGVRVRACHPLLARPVLSPTAAHAR
ncbi:hypothetical protein J0S82_013935, partial [Galemys pyrenaicus]